MNSAMMKGSLPALLITLLLLSPGAPAQAQQGFDADSVRTFLAKRMIHVPGNQPVVAVDDIQLLMLGHHMGQFRDQTILIGTTEAMLQLPQVSPGSMQAFQTGRISALYPHIWPYVVAGSFIVTGNSLGDDPVVALYNPYFDVAILTRWQFKDETETPSGPAFQIVQAVPVTGRAFREDRASRASDQPVWTDSKANLFEVRIVEAAQTFLAAFEKRYPPFGRTSVSLPTGGTREAVELVEERVFFLLKWVIDAQDPAAPVNYAAEIRELRRALSSTFSSRLANLLPADNPQDASTFFRLGESIRAGMKPYLVVDRNVIFIDPINLPTGFISVHYQEESDRGFSLGAMALFNLEARYPLTEAIAPGEPLTDPNP